MNPVLAREGHEASEVVMRAASYLHLKETKFRFNHRPVNPDKILLKLLREHPIESSCFPSASDSCAESLMHARTSHARLPFTRARV